MEAELISETWDAEKKLKKIIEAESKSTVDSSPQIEKSNLEKKEKENVEEEDAEE